MEEHLQVVKSFSILDLTELLLQGGRSVYTITFKQSSLLFWLMMSLIDKPTTRKPTQSSIFKTSYSNTVHGRAIKKKFEYKVMLQSFETSTKGDKKFPLKGFEPGTPQFQIRIRSRQFFVQIFFQVWHFPPIFVLLKLTCLVTLFDSNLEVFKNSPK